MKSKWSIPLTICLGVMTLLLIVTMTGDVAKAGCGDLPGVVTSPITGKTYKVEIGKDQEISLRELTKEELTRINNTTWQIFEGHAHVNLKEGYNTPDIDSVTIQLEKDMQKDFTTN